MENPSVLNVTNHRYNMNEIKFRAFVENKSAMYPVGIFDFNQEEVFLWTGNGHIRKRLKSLPIMQYIYRRDDNGVEIYEDDIVEFTAKIGENIAEGIGVIKRDGTSWKVKVLKCNRYTIYKPRGFISFENISNIRVIGNSHENPELLEEEKDENVLWDDDNFDFLIWHARTYPLW